MTKLDNVVIAQYDDWAGLYIDGKLVCQGHDITPWDLEKHLGIKTKWVDAEFMGERLELPDTLEEVKFDS